MNRIPVAGPWITQREIDYAAEAAATAWNERHGEFNARFEKCFAEYVGVKHAVSLPHCTAAIHLALAAAGIGSGDEVIVPNVTWIASVAPVTYVGATPILVDVDPVSWCIDPASVEAAITPQTKAIIGVDLYGSMANWVELRGIADRHNLFLLEDSAEALGSRLNDIAAGAHGDVGVFSFHGSKTVVTGEGGMLVTNSDSLFSRVKVLRDHGRAPGDTLFLNNEIAFKYKMSALQAAVGLAQMERIEELIARKREIFGWYANHLLGVDGLVLNHQPNNVLNSYWMVTIILDAKFGIDKFQLIKKLSLVGIDTRPFFSQLSDLKAFDDRPQSLRFLPTATNGKVMATYGVNLPSGYGMTEEKVERVCNELRKIIE